MGCIAHLDQPQLLAGALVAPACLLVCLPARTTARSNASRRYHDTDAHVQCVGGSASNHLDLCLHVSRHRGLLHLPWRLWPVVDAAYLDRTRLLLVLLRRVQAPNTAWIVRSIHLPSLSSNVLAPKYSRYRIAPLTDDRTVSRHSST